MQTEQSNQTTELKAKDNSAPISSAGIKIGISAPAKSVKLKAKVASELPNAISTMTYNDSVKLNLIDAYPAKKHYLFDNTITRTLYPPHILEKAVGDTITINAIAMSDSLAMDTLSSSLPVVAIAKPLTTNNTIYLAEKPLPRSHFTSYYTWMVPLLMLIVIFTGFIRLVSGKYLSNLFSSTIYGSAANNLFKTVNARNTLPSIRMNVLFVINLSLFFFEIATHFQLKPPGLQGLLLYGLVFCATLILSLIKFSSYRFLGYVFNTQSETSEFLFIANVYNKVFGLVLLPLVIIIPFVSEMAATILIQIGVALFILVYLFQMFKGVKIFLRESASVIYMFLYLCALEILPISIIVKLMLR